MALQPFRTRTNTATAGAITAALLYRLYSPSTSYPQAQHAHSHLLKFGLFADAHFAEKLISIYSALHCFNDACVVLESVPNPDLGCFSTLISFLSRSDLPASALVVARRMLSVGLVPDQFVVPSLLRACAEVSARRPGRQLHALACVSGFSHDRFVQSALVSMYLKCGDMAGARTTFDQMSEQSVVSWSAMIAGHAQRGLVDETMNWFDQMRMAGVEPNLVTWNGMIAGFSANGYCMEAVSLLERLHKEGFSPDRTTLSSVLPSIGNLAAVFSGMQVHGYAIKRGFQQDGCLVSALIDMYGQCRSTKEMVRVCDYMDGSIDVGSCNALLTGFSRNGLVDKAMQAFEEFKGKKIQLNVISWTSIIACCAQNAKDMEALSLVREMQASGIRPNKVTIPCVLPACGNIAALMHGKSVHCFSLREGIMDDIYVGSALIDMYAKCGRIGDARYIFNMMPVKNVVSWNAMLGGYAMHGDANDALELFLSMQSSGQNPDFITFACILSACSQSGMAEEGLHYFDRMQKEYGILPRTEHYACMVSLLGRAGRLEEAYSLIKEMPFTPDACIWGSLLSSCRVHGNLNFGQIAADELFKLEPTRIGNYVILSNIYASKGMQDEVKGIRDKMKKMGLNKNPGCSWIEVKNKIHILLAGDNSHPQRNEIIERLEYLGSEMKKQGYYPRTDLVLQDVEEQDKEQILCGHSEKMAVAVGLLNTRPETPLRVIKNLRICGDCHVFIKFVSKFEKREISVRDTNRFHHFKDGTCSCSDYW